MSMIKKSISVTDQQDQWIKAQIAKGLYGNDSEVIRDLIRQHRRVEQMETPAAIQTIKRKLEAAESSEFIEQSAEDILAEIKGELE